MRPLVSLLALCALPLFCACQAGSGPSSALDLQPGVGGGARVFAGPEDGVGAAARVDLGKYCFRTGKAAEPAPVVAPPAAPPGAQVAPCPGGVCRARGRPSGPRGAHPGRCGAPVSALRAVLGSRYAGLAVVLLAGLAACQGVELGVGVKPAVPPPDPAMVKQIEEARTAVAAAEERAKEATRLAAEAEAARVAASASVADLERRVVAGEATQEDLDRARRRAAEAATEATQAKERADRARAWTDEFAARVATANDRLAKAEQAWRDAAGGGLDIEGPKDTSPWGLISWALSTGLLVVLNEKRKRDAKAALEEAKRDSRDVVARQDDAPFVGTAGRLAGVRCQAPMYTSSLSGLLRQASQSPRLVRFWGGLAPPEVPFGNSVSRVLHTAAGGNANPSTWEPGTNAPLLAR